MALNQGQGLRPQAMVLVTGAFLGIMLFAYAFSGHPQAPTEEAAASAEPAAGGPPPFVKQKIDAYKQVLKYDPKNVEALTGLGNMYFDAAKWSKAADYYQQALAVKPELDDVRTDMGIAYLNMDLKDVAAGEFRKVLKHNPRHANAGYNLGIVLHSTGHQEEARQVWLQTLKVASPEQAANIRRFLGEKST